MKPVGGSYTGRRENACADQYPRSNGRRQVNIVDTNSLRGAALALTGVAAHIAAETTGSKTAAKVAAWADRKLEDDAEGTS
jgi:hypothetical protein